MVVKYELFGAYEGNTYECSSSYKKIDNIYELFIPYNNYSLKSVHLSAYIDDSVLPSVSDDINYAFDRIISRANNRNCNVLTYPISGDHIIYMLDRFGINVHKYLYVSSSNSRNMKEKIKTCLWRIDPKRMALFCRLPGEYMGDIIFLDQFFHADNPMSHIMPQVSEYDLSEGAFKCCIISSNPYGSKVKVQCTLAEYYKYIVQTINIVNNEHAQITGEYLRDLHRFINTHKQPSL